MYRLSASETRGELDTLNRAHRKRPITLLIHGDAPGADRLANRWAEEHAVRRAPYPVDVTTGPAAEQIRNQRMLDAERPDGVAVFGDDQETADLVERAKAAGLPVWVPYATNSRG